MRMKLIEDEQLWSKIPDMQLSDDDTPLVEHISKLVKEWQALPKDEQDPYLNIPAEDADEPIPKTLTRYQVRLTHQVVRNHEILVGIIRLRSTARRRLDGPDKRARRQLQRLRLVPPHRPPGEHDRPRPRGGPQLRGRRPLLHVSGIRHVICYRKTKVKPGKVKTKVC